MHFTCSLLYTCYEGASMTDPKKTQRYIQVATRLLPEREPGLTLARKSAAVQQPPVTVMRGDLSRYYALLDFGRARLGQKFTLNELDVLIRALGELTLSQGSLPLRLFDASIREYIEDEGLCGKALPDCEDFMNRVATLDGAERTALLDLAELRRLMPERPDLAKFLGYWGVEPQKRG